MFPFQSHTRSKCALLGIDNSRCWIRVKNTVSMESIRLMVNIARTVRLMSLNELSVSMVAAADVKSEP